MNELIKLGQSDIGGDKIETVNARDLHGFLESRQEFAHWIKARIQQYGFTEGVDFTIDKIIIGKNVKIDYFLTIDMAKELSMVERNDKGKQARQYFIACEKRAKTPFDIPNTFSDALRLAADESERANAAEAKIIEAQPKVDFFDSFINANGLYGLENVARALECRPKLFVRWLKADYLFYQGGALVPYVKYRQSGLFEVKSTVVDEVARLRTWMTPKGLAYFGKRVPESIKLNRAA